MKGYKHTELGWIPEEWECLELSHITQNERPISYGIVQTGLPVDDGIKCIRVLDIVDGKIDDQNLITTSHEISNAYKRTVLKEGDLVMALRGKIGELARATKSHEGYNLTRGVALVAPKINYDSEYLKQQISSPFFRDYLMAHLNGSALKELAINVVRRIKVPIPKNKSEQLKIAEVLSTWDKSIETLTQLIAAKQQLKKGLMQQLLTGKKRFEEFKNEKWHYNSLGDIASIRRGASPRPINNPNFFSHTGRGWIRISDVTFEKGKLLNFTSQYLSDLGASHSVKVEIGDLIMSICATIGVPKIVNIPSCIHDGFVLIRDYETSLEKEFLYHFIEFITPKLADSGQPGTQRNLNTDIVSRIQIPVLSLSEQKKIAEVLSFCDNEIIDIEKSLENCKLQKQGLMQQLLTGKKRVKV
ncbi:MULTISPECIES: restriction endonuclease subunit S [Niastella]|uniref:Restriction endonuclease subunit S n=1 Tax=Niastella soli TaxID=2821487 RepID=A0ABS3YTS4_9BACT|nr:restriction endonuclease subunit S [Niastella soli]MBO9200606.1 restriction endonuclease subunit S [Niastella soli]